MLERFVFHPDPSFQTVLNAFEAPRMSAFLDRTVSEFSSLGDLLRHTQTVGTSSVVHEPDGLNVALVNVSKREFAHAVLFLTEAAAHFG